MPTMKRKGECLADSVGRDWFRRRVIGAYMLREGKVIKLVGLRDNGAIDCVDMAGLEVRIPKVELKGFGQLAYPQLGYRAIEDKIYFLSRRQNYQRGLRRESLKAEYSPASRAIVNEYNLRDNQPEPKLMQAVFLPNYDGPRLIDEMLAGDRLGVVLNHDVMIEPSVAAGDDDYVVYFRERPCGRMSAAKQFKWYAPEYKVAVEGLLGGYGVHE